MKPGTVLLFILFFVATFFISCGVCSKKVDCPAYKDDLLDAWFPYTDNQKLIFRSTLTDADTVVLKNTQTTEAYQETGSFERDVICTAGKTFQSTERDTAGSFKFYLQLSTGDGWHDAQVYVQQTNIVFANFSEMATPQVTLNNRTATSQSLQNFTLLNRNFASVVESKVDTSGGKISGIYKLYSVKGEGIVGYSIYPSLKTWVKQ